MSVEWIVAFHGGQFYKIGWVQHAVMALKDHCSVVKCLYSAVYSSDCDRHSQVSSRIPTSAHHLPAKWSGQHKQHLCDKLCKVGCKTVERSYALREMIWDVHSTDYPINLMFIHCGDVIGYVHI